MYTLNLSDWQGGNNQQPYPYRIPAYEEEDRDRFNFTIGRLPIPTWKANPEELGKKMRDMSLGLIPQVPCPELPSWDEFRKRFIKTIIKTDPIEEILRSTKEEDNWGGGRYE